MDKFIKIFLCVAMISYGAGADTVKGYNLNTLDYDLSPYDLYLDYLKDISTLNKKTVKWSCGSSSDLFCYFKLTTKDNKKSIKMKISKKREKTKFHALFDKDDEEYQVKDIAAVENYGLILLHNGQVLSFGGKPKNVVDLDQYLPEDLKKIVPKSMHLYEVSELNNIEYMALTKKVAVFISKNNNSSSVQLYLLKKDGYIVGDNKNYNYEDTIKSQIWKGNSLENILSVNDNIYAFDDKGTLFRLNRNIVKQVFNSIGSVEVQAFEKALEAENVSFQKTFFEDMNRVIYAVVKKNLMRVMLPEVFQN